MLIGMVEFFPIIDPVASLRITEPKGSSAKGELIASEPAGEIKVSFDRRRLFSLPNTEVVTTTQPETFTEEDLVNTISYVLELGEAAFRTIAAVFRVKDSWEDLGEVESEPDLLPKHERPLHSNSERFSLGDSGNRIGSLYIV
jgi:hypothetical protein